MKMKILTLALTMLLALAVVPVFSFTPPGPGNPPFVLYITPETKTFTGPCVESTHFDAQVCVYEVRNLYAWELAVYWDTTYLELTGHTILVPPGWGPTSYTVLFDNLENDTTWQRLHWAVTYLGAYPSGLGFNGSCPLATLNFHIIYEPQWNNPGTIVTKIQFSTEFPPKFANGCTGVITPNEIHDSTLTLVPSKPNMEVLFSNTFDLTKKAAQGYYKLQVITAYVWVSNATKLYEIGAHVTWDKDLLDIDLQQITINEAAFPMPWVGLYQCLTPGSFYFEITRPGWDGKEWIKEPIKGTFWILKLDFKVKCYPAGEHVPHNSSTLIDLPQGIDQNYLYMCENHAKYYDPADLSLSKAKYYWTPILYDFSQDGHVGVEDIGLLMKHYGEGSGSEWNLNAADGVDIYDVVLVAKKYCNKTPPVLAKDPPYVT
jgi:hypothetical protein